MSGRTKRILYQIADVTLFLALGVGMLAVTLFLRRPEERSWQEELAYCGALLVLVLGLPVLLHECGHLLFGTLAGMKLASFSFRSFYHARGAVAGATAMYPKNGKHVKGKFLLFTLGGAVCNLSVGTALFLLWLLLPYHPALLYCGTISGFIFFEGVHALLPAELPAGKTDGAVLLGLLKNRPEEEVALRVLTAQGILYRGKFSDIPEELLFSTPVVREDLPAFHALLFLRAQYLLARGQSAEDCLERLSSLREYLSEEEGEELGRYRSLAGFCAKRSPFAGVNELEAELEARAKRGEEN